MRLSSAVHSVTSHSLSPVSRTGFAFTPLRTEFTFTHSLPKPNALSIAPVKGRPIVSVDWLGIRFYQVVPFDTSWFLSSAKGNTYSAYLKSRIPGALYFDPDSCPSPAPSYSHLPYMLPTKERFTAIMRSIGVQRTDHLICYDTSPKNFTAARMWWMLRYFGHVATSVLDGGMARYDNQGYPRTKWKKDFPATSLYEASLSGLEEVATLSQVLDNIVNPQFQLLDARSEDRFAGRIPEPQPNCASGHVPNAINIPFTSLLDPQTSCFLPREKLQAVFERAGVKLFRDRPIIVMCGNGIAACNLRLALATVAPKTRVLVYDGAWAEYGDLSADRPIAKSV